MSRSPFFRIDFKRQLHEFRKRRTHLMLVLDLRRPRGGYEPKRPKWRLVEVRRFPLDHFNSHDAQTPDIDFAPVLLAHDDFRRHPVGGADHGAPFGVRVIDLRAETEIGFGWLVDFPFALWACY